MPRPIGDEIPELRTVKVADIQEFLAKLDYQPRVVFQLRTGIGDGFRYSLREVAHIFKTTPERISRMQRRTRQKFLFEIAKYVPESKVSQVEVESIVGQVQSLTPYLIEHLRANPTDLQRLHWRVFEELIGEFFASWGYEDVRLMGRSPSTAADIFALKKSKPDGTELRVFVEVKRWKETVGVEVIDRVYGAFLAEKQTFGWHMAMVVTVAGFSNMVKYTPQQLTMLGIHLKNGDDVKQWLKDYRFAKNGLWLPQQ